MTRLLLPVFLFQLAAASFARADPPPSVLDGAKLFSPKALERVDQVAAELRETWHLDLRIETAQSPPGLEDTNFKVMKPSTIRAQLRRVAQDRADELGIKGLYGLITLEPPSATVVGWPATQERERITSWHKRRELEKSLARIPALLRDGQPRRDPEALQERGLALVRAVELFRRDVGEPHQASPMHLLMALAVTGSLLGFWLILMFARSRVAKPQNPASIYQPAMQGSLFGVPAGFWVYDRLFQAERPAPPEPLISENPIEATPPLVPSEEIQDPAAGEPI